MSTFLALSWSSCKHSTKGTYWRRLGLLCAHISMHGGIHASYIFSDTNVMVYDERFPDHRLQFSTASEKSDLLSSKVNLKGLPPSTQEMFKRFAVGLAALFPGVNFWLETGKFRTAVGQYWVESFKTASQWLVQTLPHIMMTPTGAPPPDPTYRLPDEGQAVDPRKHTPVIPHGPV